MVEHTITLPNELLSDTIIAIDVSEHDYMEHYSEDHHEWVGGVVLKMSPVSFQHDEITGYLRELFRAYFAIKAGGVVKSDPFVMRLTLKDKVTRRQPDLQVILQDSFDSLKDTYTDGAADICIEVVSSTSSATDYGNKFTEYEQAGVKEYWIIDPLRKSATFYCLSDENLYQQQAIADESYQTPLLSGLKIHVPTLWQTPLPDIIQTVKSVQEMLT